MSSPASRSQPAALHGSRVTFRAIVRTVIPEAEGLGDGDWSELESIVERALADREPAIVRQLRLFLRLIEQGARLRYGRAFSRLDAPRRTRFLAALQDSPALLLRRGFWGLRTLAFMGYYGRPAAAAEIGYRPSPLGWTAPP
jgi:hypothetical protein